jgi:hypothetical protein
MLIPHPPPSSPELQMTRDLDTVLGYSHLKGDEFHIDLCYPRCEESVKSFVVGLMDVRAADSIRVSYDFERDGWKIEQASTFEWNVGDPVCDPDWQEVAFVKAWARETEPVR